MMFVWALPVLYIMSCTGSKKSEEESATSEDTTATQSESMPEGRVYFIAPQDGDSLQSPVVVEMGVEGMAIEPAGEVHEGMGHHHLIINGSYVEKGVVIPADSTHIHFGKGQTSDTLNLKPGDYSLTLQFADGLHQSYGEGWSSTIHITVLGNK